MSYQSATDVLPADLIKEIQRYMDGGCLYIPSSKRKSWGSQNGSRGLYRQRDMEIYQAHQHGVDDKTLAEQYRLSLKAIEKILAAQRKRNE